VTRGALPLVRATATNSCASSHHHVMTPVSMVLLIGFLAGDGDGGDVIKSNLVPSRSTANDDVVGEP
jgi:hypothetical protein